MAKLLIKNGADVNAVDQNGVSSLQLAVFESNYANPSSGEQNNHHFIHLDYKRVVDLLIQSGANVNHQDNEGKSVLHWAAPKGNPLLFSLKIKLTFLIFFI